MSNPLFEMLEGRTLFAAAPIPPAVATAYAKLVQDDAAVLAAGRAQTATLKADAARVAADVKALGKNKVNSALSRQITSDANKDASAVKSAVNVALGIAKPGFRNLELAEAAISAKPTTANERRLFKSEAKVEGVLDLETNPKVDALLARAETAAGALGAALSALAAENPAAAEGALGTVLDAAAADSAAVGDPLETQLSNGEADVDALLALVTE